MESYIYRYDWDAPREHNAPFHIYSHGISEKMPKGIYHKTHKLPEWLFIYFYDNAQWIDEGTPRPIKSGSLMIWPPGRLLSYGNPDKPWRHSWLQCTGTHIPKILQESHVTSLQPISMPRPILVERHLLRIFTEVSAHHKPDQRLLQNIFHNWIIEMARVIQETESKRPLIPEPLESTKRHLDLHLDEKISLSQMARMSHFSVSHFSALFKRYYAQSPIEYQLQRRMEYAQHLLDAPGHSITEIARRTGYSDLYQFSKMFKKHVGKSPSVYRKELASS